MPSTSPCSRSRCGRSATLRRHRGPAEPPSGRPANWSVDPGDPDQVLRAAVEGTAVEAAEDLVDGEARGGQQAQHLLGMAEVHFEQAVTPFEDQTVLVEDLGHPALAGNLGDRVEAVVLPQRDALAGVGVASVASQSSSPSRWNIERKGMVTSVIEIRLPRVGVRTVALREPLPELPPPWEEPPPSVSPRAAPSPSGTPPGAPPVAAEPSAGTPRGSSRITPGRYRSEAELAALGSPGEEISEASRSLKSRTSASDLWGSSEAASSVARRTIGSIRYSAGIWRTSAPIWLASAGRPS